MVQLNTTPPIRIGLVQINNSFSGQCYLPYSTGLLQSYLLKHAQSAPRLEFLLPVYVRMNVNKAVEQLAEADLLFFSSYVWNIHISLEIARRLKDLKPKVKIVFGGPQVPDQAEGFLRKNRFIDIVIHGEGEQTACSLVDAFDIPNDKPLPGTSYIDARGNFVTHPKGPRIQDMSTIPSPYLSGAFEALMEAHPEQKWIALWETNRGCPFSCTFCDWGSSTQSKVYQFDLERLYKEVNWFAEKRIEFIFCCDANFGILPRDLDIARYVADIKSKTGFPKALSVQNTKNATERAYQVQKTLSDAGLNKGVTLSMQSMDNETLKLIKRQNISSDSYQELQRRFTRDKVETYSDLILGLPGETYQSFSEGVSKIIENGQHNRIQFNNLSILPNAEMGNPEYQKKYGMVTIESEIINFHGKQVDIENDIVEKQQLVIATGSMPKEDWVRTRAFCWMVSFVYFDKILQIPILLTQKLTGLPFKKLLEVFTDSDLSKFPVMNEVRTFFIDKARGIQNGGAEYCLSPEYLGIYWPADEYILIQLLATNKIDAFYEDARGILLSALAKENIQIGPILDEAILLNKSLLKRPFKKENVTLSLEYNLLEVYRALTCGEEIPIEKKPRTFRIDQTSVTWNTWDDFCREVIWYGNKKGAYLYTNCTVEPEIAGIY